MPFAKNSRSIDKQSVISERVSARILRWKAYESIRWLWFALVRFLENRLHNRNM